MFAASAARRIGSVPRKVTSRRPEPACRIGVADEGRGQLAASRTTQVAALGDGRTEPEEDRFVDERLESMAGDDGDQQVDRVGAQIDRRTDDRPSARRRDDTSRLRTTSGGGVVDGAALPG